MNKILKNTLILTAITVIAGTALGLVYEITKDPIAKAEADAKAAASAPKPPASTPSNPAETSSTPPPSVGGFVNAGSAKIWTYPNQSALSQYYGRDPKYRVQIGRAHV